MGSPVLPYTPTVPPAGISAASLWAPSAYVDPAAPARWGADKIDPATAEYASLLGGRNAVDAAILTQFQILRGSGAAVLPFGQRFEDIKKNDASAPALIQREIERIFQPFVTAGSVQVVSIAVETANDEGDSFVIYRNLTTRKNMRLGLSNDGNTLTEATT